MREIWKPIKDYENLYVVSNFGRIKSSYTNKILKPVKQNTGYYRVSLCKGNIKTNYYIHRLVAEAFLLPSKYPEVNHKDGNKFNNNVRNLEWCTRKYNVNHSVKILGNKLGKSKCVKCIETGQIFSSLTEASNFYNQHASNLSNLLNSNSRCKTFAGHHWKFI